MNYKLRVRHTFTSVEFFYHNNFNDQLMENYCSAVSFIDQKKTQAA